MNKKSVTDIDVKGKKVLVRVDFNVPQDADGRVTDVNRIEGALPTIRYLMKNGAKTILCSHLGRPKGGFEAKFSLKPVVEKLNEYIDGKAILASDVVGPDAHDKVARMKNGEVVVLENVRLHKEEEANDPAFSKELASLAEIYVNDAFGTAHRAHSSTAGVADYLPAVSGFLIAAELDIMGGALENPARPFLAILGGAKVSDKIGVINNLLEKVDRLIIGGAMAYTFIKAKGGNVGSSKVELDKLDLARELLAKAEAKNVKVYLPVTNVVTVDYRADAPSMVAVSSEIPDGWQGMDIGPETRALYVGAIAGAKTIVWNGPMGVFEFDNFAAGTRAIAEAVANSGAVSIIGGGDSAAAIEQMGFSKKVTHISTGGGASLEFLEGRVLPGIACLMDK